MSKTYDWTNKGDFGENGSPRASEGPSASWIPKVYHPPFKDRSGVEWKAISKVIKARDKHSCQSCGIKIGLSVHHILPRDMGGKDYPPNLITLCRFCHDEIEELGYTDKWQIIDFKRERKYIKGRNIASKNTPTHWHQWVYGGYNRPPYGRVEL